MEKGLGKGGGGGGREGLACGEIRKCKTEKASNREGDRESKKGRVRDR